MRRFFLVLFTLLLATSIVQAQQATLVPMNAQYDADGGDFSFMYPDGWLIVEAGTGVALLANTVNAQQNLFTGQIVQSGELGIYVFGDHLFKDRYGTHLDRVGLNNLAQRVANDFRQFSFLPSFTILNPLNLVDGRVGVSSEAFTDQLGGFFAVIDNGDGTFVGMIGVSPLYEYSNWQTTLYQFMTTLNGGHHQASTRVPTLIVPVGIPPTFTQSPIPPTFTATAIPPTLAPGQPTFTPSPIPPTFTATPILPTLIPRQPTSAVTVVPPTFAPSTPIATPARDSASLNWVSFDVLHNQVGAVAIANDLIYVADGSDGVLALSMDGTVLGKLNVADIQNANDIDLAPNGDLWIADPTAKRLWRVTPTGEMVTSIDGGDHFAADNFPTNVEASSDDQVYIYDRRADGDWIQVWSGTGSFEREFRVPLAQTLFPKMSISPDNYIYIADGANGISILDAQGTLIRQNLFLSGLKNWYVRGFEVMADGTLFLGVDSIGDTTVPIWHLDSRGNVLGQYTGDQMRSRDFTAFTRLAAFAQNGDALIVVDLSTFGSKVLSLKLTPITN